MSQFQVGQRVRYKDMNLWDHVGRITAIGRTPRGGDCTVEWARLPGISCEECLCNLEVVPE